MGDHSSATLFRLGDVVIVTDDVMKAGKNLKGLSGEVIETWEKCDVDPTCCCAEWVDEGLSVHVRFKVSEDEGNGLFANDTFVHYFAESELIKKKEDAVVDDDNQQQFSNNSEGSVAFDGMSCKAFKLDKLSMGEQAKRIKAFEESRQMKEG